MSEKKRAAAAKELTSLPADGTYLGHYANAAAVHLVAVSACREVMAVSKTMSEGC